MAITRPAQISIMIFLCFTLMATRIRAAEPTSMSVFFSPNGGCAQAVISEIDHAKHHIEILAYAFTSQPIARALLNAAQRSVLITAIVDPLSSRTMPRLLTPQPLDHIRIYVDHAHAIQHNKVILIDGATIITGSYNWTTAAEQHNAENLLVIHSTAIATLYQTNWSLHLSHSSPIYPVASPPPSPHNLIAHKRP